jgi:predicted outer membrane repeat protein
MNQVGADCKACFVRFKGTNNFTNNFATLQGGAISFTSAKYIELPDSKMILQNNTAALMNVSIASYSASVKVEIGKGAAAITSQDQKNEVATALDAYSLANLGILEASEGPVERMTEFPSG